MLRAEMSRSAVRKLCGPRGPDGVERKSGGAAWAHGRLAGASRMYLAAPSAIPAGPAPRSGRRDARRAAEQMCKQPGNHAGQVPEHLRYL